MEGDLKKRLVYLPLENCWRVEYLTPEENIQDFIELTISGVAYRFYKDAIIDSLRRAATALEMDGKSH